MKVLHVIPALPKGGAERLCLDMCHGLRKAGVEVVLMVMREGNAYKELTADLPIVTSNSRVQLSVLGRNKVDMRSYTSFVDSYKPDVIHSHLFEAEIFSREVTYPDIKYFTHCHSNNQQFRRLSDASFSKKDLTEWYEKRHLFAKYKACNNHFIAISKHTESYLKEVLPHSLQANIHLLPNAIDYHLFSKVGGSIKDISSLRLINVGTFFPNKNQAFLLKVVRALLDKGQNVQLTFLGTGVLFEQVQKAAAEMNLLEHIKFKGAVPNVQDYLGEANVYVHAAKSEAFGLVNIEAMATGLPVVAYDGGGNRDVVIDGFNGYLLKEFNEQMFAEKIMEVVNNRQAYQTMSVNAAGFARQFDLETYIYRLIEVYKAPTGLKSR